MKITIDLPASELTEICFFTGEKKKEPAIRKMVMDALMMKRREALAHKFITGEWGVELSAFEEGQAKDRRATEKMGRACRGK